MGPAEQLAGLELQNGWTVLEKVQRKPTATGGNISVGYWAKHADVTQGFLKSLDYTWNVAHKHTAAVLNAMTKAQQFPAWSTKAGTVEVRGGRGKDRTALHVS